MNTIIITRKGPKLNRKVSEELLDLEVTIKELTARQDEIKQKVLEQLRGGPSV